MLLGVLSVACAQEPVRIVVPAPPGGNLDMTARAVAQRLATLTGEPYVVENRPGANTAIGTEYVAHAPADGRTMLMTGGSIVLTPWLQPVGYTPDELRPVVQVTVGHYALVASSESKIVTAEDLIAQAKGRSQGLTCAAPPGPMWIACEQAKSRLDGKVTVIPYPGIGPAMTAIAGGHVDFAFLNAEAVEPMIKAGRLRVLATSKGGAQPRLPRIVEVWPGFLLEGYAGLFVPARTPAEKVAQINREVNQILNDAQFAAYMRDSQQEVAGGSPENFAASVDRDFRRYGDLVRKLNIEAR